jgi:hypothetical protein
MCLSADCRQDKKQEEDEDLISQQLPGERKISLLLGKLRKPSWTN